MPHTAFTENWRWFQFLIGLALARLVVAFLFIQPSTNINARASTSSWAMLRPGHAIHRLALLPRHPSLIASGVRLYATCMAVSKILDWPLASTIALFTVVSILFIAFGGIKAVVWAGAYRAIFFTITGVLVVVYLLGRIDGGLTSALHTAREAGRLSTFNFRLDLHDAGTFWAGLAGGFFTGLVSFGADQEMVQRLLTVKTRRSSQKTILATIVTVLPVYWLYLLIGTLLYVFYARTPLCRCHRRPRRSFLTSPGRSCPPASRAWSSLQSSWPASIRP